MGTDTEIASFIAALASLETSFATSAAPTIDGSIHVGQPVDAFTSETSKDKHIMKAIVIHSRGGPENLRLEDAPIGDPGRGQVLINIAAAGVNFMDTGALTGTTSQSALPLTPGVEGAGTVAAVGEGVSGVKVGDRVAWYYVWGSYAEQLIAPVEAIVVLPDDIAFETAASLMMQGLTASNCVFQSHEVKPGQTALVHAVAGGVGLLLTQMIKILGGSVIGRVSSPDKVAAAKEAGADEVIIDRTGAFADEVLRLTGGRGVDVVYDGTGQEGFEDSMRSVDYHGTLALFGSLMAPIPAFSPLSLPKSIKITYPVVMHHVRTPEMLTKHSRQLFDWVRDGKLRTHIGGRYPLADAEQAHRDIQSRRTTGKLLLLP